MATYTPPPYFPQSSLAPPDKNRYLKFRLLLGLAALLVLALLTGLGFGIWSVAKWVF